MLSGPAVRLLDLIAQEVVYRYGYERGTDGEGFLTSGDSALISPRRFRRRDRTLEIGLSRNPDSVLAVRIVGTATAGENPDVARLAAYARKKMPEAGAESAPGAGDLAVQSVSLSYTTADRALAILKSLGYTTIEQQAAAGDVAWERTYTSALHGSGKLPIIIKTVDPPKTSLLDPEPSGGGLGGVGGYGGFSYGGGGFGGGSYGGSSYGGGGGGSGGGDLPAIGGQYLHHPTTGEPVQRLLILYDPHDVESLQALLQVLGREIDVPARQVVVEALVIEVNLEDLEDIGARYHLRYMQGGFDFPSVTEDGREIPGGPFVGLFDNAFDFDSVRFSATIEALLRDRKAEVLANPSVFVLDGRQARVQIAQQRPITEEFVRVEGTNFNIRYIPVGIVLNLKPRIADDERNVTMQVEAIVSQISPESETRRVGEGTTVEAPIIDSRIVQSFVRVANNTPFIVGGLIQNTTSLVRDRIPVLWRIPWLGTRLFGRTNYLAQKREVIVVLTPHVVPREERDFSYLIPKDSSKFDVRDTTLFRHSYRLREKDVFDLSFVTESAALKRLREQVSEAVRLRPALASDREIAPFLKGRLPGEEVIVWKMLAEVIEELRLTELVKRSRILYFADDPASPDGRGYTVQFLAPRLEFLGPEEKKRRQTALILSFDRSYGDVEAGQTFDKPVAEVTEWREPIPSYDTLVQSWNQPAEEGAPGRWSIVLHDAEDLKALDVALVLKEMVDLNAESGLDLASLRVGRQILLPTEGEGVDKFFIVDRRTAEYFYQVRHYYSAFEDAFAQETRRILAKTLPGAPLDITLPAPVLVPPPASLGAGGAPPAPGAEAQPQAWGAQPAPVFPQQFPQQPGSGGWPMQPNPAMPQQFPQQPGPGMGGAPDQPYTPPQTSP